MQPGAGVRAGAARAVHAVRHGGRTLDDALAAMGSPGDDARDCALLQALAYGTVRWYLRLSPIVEQLLTRPLKARDAILGDLLAVGLYQLLYMRVPAHAAVHATVAAAALLHRGHAGPLVNAVLRRFQREREALLGTVDARPAQRHAYPQWLVDALAADWPDDLDVLLACGNDPPPMWLRVNRRHSTRDAYLERLRAEGLDADAHPDAPDALCLRVPVDVQRLPGWVRGDVSVQDAAAQLATDLLALAPGQRVLDACAAPGGKTAHMLEREPKLAEVVALEHSGDRLQELKAGLLRLSLDPTLVQGDAMRPSQWWDGRAFQRILLDAPCSASGVIRRHPDIKLLRRVGDLPALVAQQEAMLEALWPLLAPGGRLVYATCSVLKRENENQIAAFLQRHPEAMPVGPTGHGCAVGRQILTGETNMDGFYYACLQHSPDVR